MFASAIPHQVEHAVVLFVSSLPVCGRKVVSKIFEVDGVNAVGKLRPTEKHPFRERSARSGVLSFLPR